MKARPILMSAPMVRALLDGRKTQTRRVVKPQPVFPHGVFEWTPKQKNGIYCIQTSDGTLPSEMSRYCPYGKPGDLLWVRESFWEGTNCYTDPSGESVGYWTDKIEYLELRSKPGPWSEPYVSGVPWMLKRPSIHMPRRASRITLAVTGVRVERLQDISERDAYAEGVTIPSHLAFASNGNPDLRNEARDAYRQLWNGINGPGSWEANPWVWVLEFRVHQVNVNDFISSKEAA